MTIAICGLKFFFEHTLQKEWATFNIVRPAPEKKLPVILSVAEVHQLLSLIRLPRYKVCLWPSQPSHCPKAVFRVSPPA